MWVTHGGIQQAIPEEVSKEIKDGEFECDSDVEVGEIVEACADEITVYPVVLIEELADMLDEVLSTTNARKKISEKPKSRRKGTRY